MNAQDYISSGLLEAYVVGGLSLTESEQVAGAMCRFPEVALEVARLQEDLFRMAESDAVAPPPGLEDQIWAAIQASGAATEAPNHAATISLPPPASANGGEKPATRVIAFEGAPIERRNTFGMARAAVIALLIGSVAANVMLWRRPKTLEQEVTWYKRQAEYLSTEKQTLTASLDRYKREAEMMAQPGMMPVPMLSTQPGHPMAATIYWDKAKSEAYVSVQKLPPPPTGMQYQLWAIADGKPVDLGMMSNEVASSGGMQKVPKAVTTSQAFAVSLERAGGVPSPTADKIFLLGKMPAT